MPLTERASAANVCYHVLNRGDDRACVFHQDGDFQAIRTLAVLSSFIFLYVSNMPPDPKKIRAHPALEAKPSPIVKLGDPC